MGTRKYKKPDLNAPRFRPKKLNLTNADFYKQFVEDHPKYAFLSVEKFKEVIKTFNGLIWKSVIELRDGVELPEQLGYLFIGTCPRKVSTNIDYKRSADYEQLVQNQNWESDQYLAKIFYTNFESKYRFRHHDMWGFSALRDFKRTVAKTYPLEWKKYVMVDNIVKISRLYRKEKNKQSKQQEDLLLLDYYDEFNLEEPWLKIPLETLSQESVIK